MNGKREKETDLKRIIQKNKFFKINKNSEVLNFAVFFVDNFNDLEPILKLLIYNCY